MLGVGLARIGALDLRVVLNIVISRLVTFHPEPAGHPAVYCWCMANIKSRQIGAAAAPPLSPVPIGSLPSLPTHTPAV